MPRLKVTGIEAAIKLNESISDKKKYDNLHREIVENAVIRIQNKCPRDTGKLLNTIRYIKTADGYIIYVGGKEAPYVIFMEYGFRGFDIGTVEHPIFKKSGYHPFIRSSLWETNLEYSNYIKRILFNVK